MSKTTFGSLKTSNYINRGDVNPPLLLTVTAVRKDVVRDPKTGQETPKTVVYFAEIEKGDVLGWEKGLSYQAATGVEFIEDLVGHKVVLFDDLSVRGPDGMGGVRARAPSKPRAATPKTPPLQETMAAIDEDAERAAAAEDVDSEDLPW